jgi:hypothetical protein
VTPASEDEITADAHSTEAVEALGRLQSLLPLWAPVSQCAVFDAERLSTLRALMVAVARATESTLLLCIYRQLWDAEMVLRSVFEATLKSCYLLQSPAMFEERYREFSDDLWHVELLRGHKKTVEMLSVIDGLDERWGDLRARLLLQRKSCASKAAFRGRPGANSSANGASPGCCRRSSRRTTQCS